MGVRFVGSQLQLLWQGSLIDGQLLEAAVCEQHAETGASGQCRHILPDVVLDGGRLEKDRGREQ